MAHVTEGQVDEVVAMYERHHQATREANEEKERGRRADMKRALLELRLPWRCGPCRSCIAQILAEVPVDRSLCERP